MAKQTKLESLVEAVVNITVGLVIALASQILYFWWAGIQISFEQNAYLVLWMTVVSVARSYVIRRIWNSEFWKRPSNDYPDW